MNDFVEVIDDALPAALCAELMLAFERSPHRVPGARAAAWTPARSSAPTST